MRILFISNMFPPYYAGGYELRCKDIAIGLHEKGHKIKVITSDYCVNKNTYIPKSQIDIPVERYLYFRWRYPKPNLAEIGYNEWRDYTYLKKKINSFKPEVIFVWSCNTLSNSVLAYLSEINNKGRYCVVFDISDTWMVDWKLPPWSSFWERNPDSSIIKKIIKPLIKKIVAKLSPLHDVQLILKYGYFTSLSLKAVYHKKVFKAEHLPIIHIGIAETFFINETGLIKKPTFKYLKILYLGRLIAHKGALTLIKSLPILKNNGINFKASIVGKMGIEPEYEKKMNTILENNNLRESVTFSDIVPRAEVLSLLKEHHVVVFPSIGHEAFATVPLESMAAGVPVISTPVGGNKEYLKNEENALVFDPGNHNQLSSCIMRLIEDPELYNKLVINGKNYVNMYHTSKKIIDKTELYLKSAFYNHNYNNIKNRRDIA